MKTLLDKLGYKSGTPALLWNVPEALQHHFMGMTKTDSDEALFRVAFMKTRAELAEASRAIAATYRAGGHLWLLYPKKSGGIRSDITRDKGWEPVHALGLLGVAQIAVDDDWSALRFRHRDEIRLIKRSTMTGARLSG